MEEKRKETELQRLSDREKSESEDALSGLMIPGKNMR